VGPKDCLVLKVVGQKTGKSAIFMKLKDVYPECEFLIQDADQLFPLRCIRDDGCPRNQRCLETLAKRVHHVFNTFADSDLLLLYFRYHDAPGTHRAGVFWRDMKEPRFITFNRSVWERMKQIGVVYQWSLPDTLFLEKTAKVVRP
jgi:hypothetical protein